MKKEILLTTRLTGVSQQEEVQLLLKELDVMKAQDLKYILDYDGYQKSIALLYEDKYLGYLPKLISESFLYDLIKEKHVIIDKVFVIEKVGGQPEIGKDYYGLQVGLYLIVYDNYEKLIQEGVSKAKLESKTKGIELIVKSFEIKNKISLSNKHKMLLVGHSMLKKKEIINVMMDFGISPNQLELKLDYYALKNSVKLSKNYKYILFGPLPHSNKGMEDANSIIDYYLNQGDYLIYKVKDTSGKLSINKSSLIYTLNMIALEEKNNS
ncbi:MAG: hypothetical protein LBR40_02300 [Bacilli bacterium]|jgi:hypothetical protein|nr:hypothetical protein [Bacilli bacterium]